MNDSNVAFYMAMEARRFTEIELVSILEVLIAEYKQAVVNHMGKEVLEERYSHIVYMSSLITIKYGKEDPSAFAERIRNVQQFSNIMQNKLS